MQLVHMASWKGVPGTLRTRPRAVQLRWGWHCPELELLSEKVPGGHCWHCVSWVGVPGDEMGGQGQGDPGHPHGRSPGPAPPTECPAPTKGNHSIARRAGRVLQAEAPELEEAWAAAAGTVVDDGARTCLLLMLPADHVAVPAALQVVPELRVVVRRALVARRGVVPAARPVHEGAWGALATRQPLPRVHIPPWVGRHVFRWPEHSQHQQ